MSTVHTIRLGEAHRAQLRRFAEQAFPEECCGLLIGAGGDVVTVTDIIAAANLADSPASRFMIDPQVQFDALRRLRGSTERVIGHYHSHPNGLAELSDHDLTMAHDPAAVWLVIPVAAGRAGAPAAFQCPSSDRAKLRRVAIHT
jgi:proteasome lid subunit RPN8/RPN11